MSSLFVKCVVARQEDFLQRVKKKMQRLFILVQSVAGLHSIGREVSKVFRTEQTQRAEVAGAAAFRALQETSSLYFLKLFLNLLFSEFEKKFKC